MTKLFCSLLLISLCQTSSSQNIGIGTASPLRKLHVFNESYGGGMPNINAHLIVENNADNFIAILAPSTSQRGIYFGDNLNVDDAGIIYDGNSNGLFFRTNGNINRMSISSTGNVSIGGNIDIAGTTINFGSVENFVDAGANIISTNSDLVPSIDNSRRLGNSTLRWSEVWATDGTINTSDARVKTNIRDLDYGIRQIMQLRSTRFTWKDAVQEGEKLGLLAQDLKNVLPEVVRDWEYKIDEKTGLKVKVPSERMGVMYSDIIPVLIRGMQEQQRIIESLKKESDLQQLKNARLEERLLKLERFLNKE